MMIIIMDVQMWSRLLRKFARRSKVCSRLPWNFRRHCEGTSIVQHV